MKTAAYMIVMGLIALPIPALAEHKGSLEDQLACTPDVYRLCAQNIPDEDAITACLEQHKPQLSPGCKAVFSRPQAQTPAQPNADED